MAVPNELILDICGYLANPDLKACRLVSKSWSANASLYLFRKIYISPRKEDIEVFNLVTQNAQLSRCVRTLQYDGTKFSELSEEGYISQLRTQVTHYPKLYRTCLGNKDAEFTQFVKKCLKESYSEPKEFMGFDFILKGYREWKDRDEYQRRIVMNGEFLKFLECGLGKLGLLSVVEITSDWPIWKLCDIYLTGDLNHSYFYGSPFGRAWQLSHPPPSRCDNTDWDRRRRAEAPRPWVEASDTALLEAQALRSIDKQTTNRHIFEVITTALSRSQKHLRSFSMLGVPVSVFDPNVSGVIKNSSISAYSSLEQLVLGFGRTSWSSHGDAYLAAIQGLLGSMRGLRSLELSVLSDRHPRIPSYRYWNIFPTDGTQWIALTKLKLYGFSVSARNLCHLLKISMPNLRELRLLKVDLLEGRWEGVIEFLKTSMSLLSFPTKEFWQYSHQRDELFPAGLRAERLTFSKDIEDYVVNGGRHPCLRAGEDDSASTKYLSDLDL